MCFNINNRLVFIDSFHVLGSSLDSLVKKLGKADFKYLIHEFNSRLLDLAKQKEFFCYDYMSGFKKFEKVTVQKVVF